MTENELAEKAAKLAAEYRDKGGQFPPQYLPEDMSGKVFYKNYVEWKDESGKWVPGAVKFLEQERWIEYSEDSLTRFEED